METSTDEDHLRLRESVGRAMRHTGRIQQNVYNDVSNLERKRKAVEFATGAFKQAVIAIDSEEDVVAPVRMNPRIGAVVGFKDEQDAPAFGKVLRITAGDVLVMVLQHPLGMKDVLVPDATKILRKSIAELTWPIDDETSGADYLLLTSVAAMEDFSGGQ